MTKEERWIAEGRTRENLSESRKTVAALRADIEEYAKNLEMAAGHLRTFLSDPIGSGPTGMTGRQYLVHFYQPLISLDLEKKLREFEGESETMKKLEQTLQDFE
jgi:hypothetical protein